MQSVFKDYTLCINIVYINYYRHLDINNFEILNYIPLIVHFKVVFLVFEECIYAHADKLITSGFPL